MTKRLIIAASIIVLFLGAVAYFQLFLKPEMIRGFIAQNVPPPVTVTAEPVRVETWVQRLTSIGTLTAVQSIEISSQVAGVVDEILFDGGVDVGAGDILVRLNISVEDADLASARATLREAQLEYERQQDLVRKGSTAQARLDESQAKRDTATAAVDRIQALIAQKSIRAPFAGRLGIRKVGLGQYVSPGLALATLQSLDPIYADFPVPESNAGRLRTGQKVEATFGALPGELFTGQIVTLDARVSTETRTLLVRARLGNRERKLLPGMFANMAVLVGEPVAVLTVPRTAITYSLYGDSVFVVEAAKQAAAAGGKPGEAQAAEPALTAERRFVRVGEARGDRVEILEGINTGEQVVTSGQLKLQSGARIRVDNSNPLEPEQPRPRN